MSEFNQMMNKKAVALKYDEQKNISPVIVATGAGHLAEKIIEVANENKVPVYEDNSLASVLSRLELGSNIPIELYEAVVDIYVFFLKYSPKAKDAIEKASVDKISTSDRIENNENKTVEPENRSEDKQSEDTESIEYKTRQLLKELELGDDGLADGGSNKAIPWLPDEF